MEKFVVDFPTKTITVVHNPFCLTAQRIADLLSERTQLEATVSTDGADPAVWKFPETLRDAADNDNIEGMDMDEKMTYPRPTVIISGLLWVISMLSLIGGNWYVDMRMSMSKCCLCDKIGIEISLMPCFPGEDVGNI